MTPLARIRRVVAAATGPTRDEGGAALVISLLTILVATALSVAVLGSVVSQLGPAQFAMKNTRTAHAAEAGIDAALGRIRTAESVDPVDNTTIVGNRTLLPCTVGTRTGRLAGDVVGSPGAMRYDVVIRYYGDDPSGQTAAWRTSNALQCASGGGPAVTPRYALVESTGTGTGVGAAAPAAAGRRTLETVYDFQVTNANVLGGLVHTYYDGQGGTRDLCFDAGTDTPAQGAPLTVDTCSPGSSRQLFSWRSDYSIVLSVTQGSSATAGMCVTAVPGGGTTFAELRTCNGSFHQKWGYTDSGGLAGQLRYDTVNHDRTNFCLYVVNDNTPGSRVAADPGWCTGYNRRSTWRPEARVGAGHAGAVTGPVEGIPMQWVNFAEFGRCYDVTNWSLNYSFMIAYPCKQEPTGYVGWNQMMVWGGPAGNGHLYTLAGNTGWSFQQSSANGRARYCARAPLSDGGYVTMGPCDANDARMTWQVNRETGSYSTSYTVVDHRGRCMAVGPPDAGSGVDLRQWSTVVTQPCDGSGRQKWNAPPSLAPSGLRNTAEVLD